MNEQKAFPAEKEAMGHARQIEQKLQNFAAQKDVPNEKAVMADAYAKLVQRLNPYSKSPEDPVSFYLVHLGTEMSRQAKPPLSGLVNRWEKEKLASKIKPLAYRTKTELKQYARFLRRTWGNQKVDGVTRQRVEGALNELPVRNRNNHRKYLRWIRMFFIWAKDNHRLTRQNPTDGIKIKSEDYVAEFYPPEKVKNLLRYVAKTEKDMVGF